MGMFPNIEDMAKKEVAKLVTELEGEPGIKEAETAIHTAFATLKSFLSGITPAELSTALNLVFPGKFTLAQITTLEADVSAGVKGLQALQAAAHAKL